jgi:hypothetical protein
MRCFLVLALLLPSTAAAQSPRMISEAEIVFASVDKGAPATITIESARFGGKKPRLGARVTVVPLLPDLAPTTVTITGVERLAWHEVPVWELTLAPVKDPGWGTKPGPAPDGAPADAIVVYPAVTHAVFVPQPEAARGRLPARLTAAHVQWGVDTNGDGKADALMTRFCTEDRRKPACYEATAYAVYRRVKRGWKRVFVYPPVS